MSLYLSGSTPITLDKGFLKKKKSLNPLALCSFICSAWKGRLQGTFPQSGQEGDDQASQSPGRGLSVPEPGQWPGHWEQCASPPTRQRHGVGSKSEWLVLRPCGSNSPGDRDILSPPHQHQPLGWPRTAQGDGIISTDFPIENQATTIKFGWL